MGVFANAITFIGKHADFSSREDAAETRGLGEWVMNRLRHRAVTQRRLMVIERIHLAPRQTLALVEADGHKLLVATSGEGTSTFFQLKAAVTPRTSSRSAQSAGEGKRA